ncbi:MAG TPA: hypothetical protein VGJ32_02210 [Solirubrobacteraceae bacterium]|jgi:hypothetical protein
MNDEHVEHDDSTPDLVAENARLREKVEKLERRLYGPIDKPRPVSKKKGEKPRPVLVYLITSPDAELPDVESRRAVERVFAENAAKRHPEWDVRVIDDDNEALQRIPEGATVVRSPGSKQWVAERQADRIALRRVACSDDERVLLQRIDEPLARATASLAAAEAAGATREGQGHLLAVDLHTATFNVALAYWHAGRDADLKRALDEPALTPDDIRRRLSSR